MFRKINVIQCFGLTNVHWIA